MSRGYGHVARSPQEDKASVTVRGNDSDRPAPHLLITVPQNSLSFRNRFGTSALLTS